MQKVNLDIDKDGEKGRSGSVIPEILIKLNSLEFYQSSGPKSLGKEWFDSIFLPAIDNPDHSLNDLLRTVYEHIALQISKTIKKTGNPTVLVTGGGAHNNYLIERIRNNSDAQFIIPAIEIVDYKEALVFAFLGVLRYRNEVNCYASVTGATRDNTGGTIYHGKG
jgi:anhydro-N-acetylmuramic acid kinase